MLDRADQNGPDYPEPDDEPGILLPLVCCVSVCVVALILIGALLHVGAALVDML